jgi:hypothetical protein
MSLLSVYCAQAYNATLTTCQQCRSNNASPKTPCLLLHSHRLSIQSVGYAWQADHATLYNMVRLVVDALITGSPIRRNLPRMARGDANCVLEGSLHGWTSTDVTILLAQDGAEFMQAASKHEHAVVV